MIVQFIQLLLVSFLVIATNNFKAKLPHSVTIPFPFGITNACSLNPSFLITCNQTKPFLPQNNITIINISLNSELKISWPVARDCNTGRGKLVTFQVNSDRVQHPWTCGRKRLRGEQELHNGVRVIVQQARRHRN